MVKGDFLHSSEPPETSVAVLRSDMIPQISVQEGISPRVTSLKGDQAPRYEISSFILATAARWAAWNSSSLPAIVASSEPRILAAVLEEEERFLEDLAFLLLSRVGDIDIRVAEARDRGIHHALGTAALAVVAAQLGRVAVAAQLLQQVGQCRLLAGQRARRQVGHGAQHVVTQRQRLVGLGVDDLAVQPEAAGLEAVVVVDEIVVLGRQRLAALQQHHATVPFRQACWVVGTVISSSATHAVADVGLKALGMDHGNPEVDGYDVWFCSDEHVTFAVKRDAANLPMPAPTVLPRVGERVLITPAHIDPTMAMHDVAYVADTYGNVLGTWPIDLRGW